jgi:enolase
MSTIKKIQAREILDSRGNPTVEVDIYTPDFSATAAAPSGASTGIHEARELRDKNKRYLGKGVQKAVNNVNKKIFPLLSRIDTKRQREIDNLMIEKDNSVNKARLGANAILPVSLACCKVAAREKNMYLFGYINQLLAKGKPLKLPTPFFNIINGGKHADNKLSFQEFMIVPQFNSFKKNYQAGAEVYHYLKKELHKKYGKGTTNVGDEGGFAPEKMHKTEDALKIIIKAIKDAGYKNKVKIALDCAASEFYNRNKYFVDGKKLTKEQLLSYYLKLIRKYPIISIEDPFHEDDFLTFAELNKQTDIQIVGDDLTVTNITRIEEALKEKSCNCLLLKVNQIGTLTEALDAVRLAYDNGWKVMVSHRSGETEDTFIADLAVGIGCGQIKSGAPCRGERVAKYNRLLRIEERLRDKSFK